MSLPATEHICSTCDRIRGKECKRTREVKEGYCLIWVSKTVGGK
jgi:hypothetical protein